jgi:hypothetical protein
LTRIVVWRDDPGCLDFALNIYDKPGSIPVRNRMVSGAGIVRVMECLFFIYSALLRGGGSARDTGTIFSSTDDDILYAPVSYIAHSRYAMYSFLMRHIQALWMQNTHALS